MELMVTLPVNRIAPQPFSPDGTQSLFEVAARLADGKDLLNHALTTITDNNSTTKMTNVAIKVIRRSCYELQSNLIMINNCVAFDHKIPNKKFMSNVKMKSMYVYGSYPNPALTLPSLHHSMIKNLDI